VARGIFISLLVLLTVLFGFSVSSAAGPSVESGRRLFEKHCSRCHDTTSARWRNGPGLLGILKRYALPDSGWRATPENIEKILRTPYENMPSFRHLSDEEVRDIIEYLKTL
jgi:cytochrome c2